MERIAQVLKSNGVEGELLVSFIDFDPEDISLEEPVFVEFDGLPVPTTKSSEVAASRRPSTLILKMSFSLLKVVSIIYPLISAFVLTNI